MKAVLEVVRIDNIDIITTSSTPGGGDACPTNAGGACGMND